MNETQRVEIVEYLNSLHPKGVLEVAKAKADIDAIARAIIMLTERINAPRQIKLLVEEIAQLKTHTQELAQGLDEMKELDEEYENLKKKKEIILQEKMAIENMAQEQEDMIKVQSFIEKHDFGELKTAVEQLKYKNSERLGELLLLLEEATETFSGFSYDFTGEVNESLRIIQHNRNELERKKNGMANTLRLENIYFNNVSGLSKSDLQEAQEEYNNLAVQLSEIQIKLHEIKENHFKNIQIYQTHFSQNQEIWGALGKRHQIDEHLRPPILELEERLKKFDHEINLMVEKADKIVLN